MKSNMNAITLQHTIICDDVRREDNGKLILMGVYPEAIYVNTIPVNLQISIWMQFSMKIHEKIPYIFMIEGPSMATPIQFNVDLGDESIFDKEVEFPCIAKIGMSIISEGNFEIKYKKASEAKYHLAKKIFIKKNLILNEQKPNLVN